MTSTTATSALRAKRMRGASHSQFSHHPADNIDQHQHQHQPQQQHQVGQYQPLQQQHCRSISPPAYDNDDNNNNNHLWFDEEKSRNASSADTAFLENEGDEQCVDQKGTSVIEAALLAYQQQHGCFPRNPQNNNNNNNSRSSSNSQRNKKKKSFESAFSSSSSASSSSSTSTFASPAPHCGGVPEEESQPLHVRMPAAAACPLPPLPVVPLLPNVIRPIPRKVVPSNTQINSNHNNTTTNTNNTNTSTTEKKTISQTDAEQFYHAAHGAGIPGHAVHAAVIEAVDWHRKWTHQLYEEEADNVYYNNTRSSSANSGSHVQQQPQQQQQQNPKAPLQKQQQSGDSDDDDDDAHEATWACAHMPSHYYAFNDRLAGARNPSPEDEEDLEEDEEEEEGEAASFYEDNNGNMEMGEYFADMEITPSRRRRMMIPLQGLEPETERKRHRGGDFDDDYDAHDDEHDFPIPSAPAQYWNLYHERRQQREHLQQDQQDEDEGNDDEDRQEQQAQHFAKRPAATLICDESEDKKRAATTTTAAAAAAAQEEIQRHQDVNDAPIMLRPVALRVQCPTLFHNPEPPVSSIDWSSDLVYRSWMVQGAGVVVGGGGESSLTSSYDLSPLTLESLPAADDTEDGIVTQTVMHKPVAQQPHVIENDDDDDDDVHEPANIALLSSSAKLLPAVVSASPCSSPLPARAASDTAFLQEARDGILSELAISDGETTSPRFQECLEVLQKHQQEQEELLHQDCIAASTDLAKATEGTWLTLTKPTFFGCLGHTEAGDPMYTLGRMSFDMFAPTNLVCSLQGNFLSVEAVSNADRQHLLSSSSAPPPTTSVSPHHPEPQVTVAAAWGGIPKALRAEVEAGNSLLRTYNIVTAFTVESTLADDEFRNAPNQDVVRPIRGIMTTYGYTLPDPKNPHRHSIWITGGRIEANNDPADQRAWRHLLAQHPPQHTWKEQAKLLAVQWLMGAVMPVPPSPSPSSEDPSATTGQDPDDPNATGAMEYTFTRPLGGHGMAYIDTLYVDETLRIARGHRGTTFVFSRVSS